MSLFSVVLCIHERYTIHMAMVEEIKLSHVSCGKVVEPPAQGLNIGIVSCLWYYTHTGQL